MTSLWHGLNPRSEKNSMFTNCPCRLPTGPDSKRRPLLTYSKEVAALPFMLSLGGQTPLGRWRLFFKLLVHLVNPGASRVELELAVSEQVSRSTCANKAARLRNCLRFTAPSLPAEVRVHFVLPVDAPQSRAL